MRFTTRKSNALWLVQGVLAALFLFAGVFKLALPLAALAKVSPLTPALLKFIGVCEVAGAIGLIVPGVTHIREDLTALAATGLAIIMAGAVIVTVATQGVAQAVVPCFVGMLAATIARLRWQHTSLVPEPSTRS